jgi:hypothetical protein
MSYLYLRQFFLELEQALELALELALVLVLEFELALVLELGTKPLEEHREMTY